MRELSLFTGAGGGVLGTHHLLGWRTCGYVEWNEYCQKVIAARINDGYLTEAPIFTDVREFVQSGAAGQYKGIADVVTAGFPCQPFSVAGKQEGVDDERNMWPATRDVIRIVQPQSVLLENVPGLISCGYVGTVIADLATLGYVGKWGVIGTSDSAWDFGDPAADHERHRLWIVASKADAKGQFSNGRSNHTRVSMGGKVSELGDSCGSKDVRALPNTNSIGQPGSWWAFDPGDPAPSDDREVNRAFYEVRWGIESQLGRVAPRMACGMDRLKAIGNGQVSCVVARAWQELSQ